MNKIQTCYFVRTEDSDLIRGAINDMLSERDQIHVPITYILTDGSTSIYFATVNVRGETDILYGYDCNFRRLFIPIANGVVIAHATTASFEVGELRLLLMCMLADTPFDPNVAKFQTMGTSYVPKGEVKDSYRTLIWKLVPGVVKGTVLKLFEIHHFDEGKETSVSYELKTVLDQILL